MTDIEPAAALEMVERGLRLDVLPVVDDGHATAALRAALTIIGNVRARIEVGDRALRDMLDAALPVADGWAAAISAIPGTATPGTAERVRSLIGRARATSGTDPAAARADLLNAAQLSLEAAWHDGEPDRNLLAALRRVTRLDAEADALATR